MRRAEAMASSMAGKVRQPLRRMRMPFPSRSGMPVTASISRANSGVPGEGGSSMSNGSEVRRRNLAAA